jgi:iron complex transport system ATP-binding protein
MSELISCESVGYRQQNVDILVDINWRIDYGQHWAVLGPNGSGKTRLLRIACGYLWPTSGRVLRLGEELIDLGELRRSIGWISSAMIADIPPSDTGLETVVSGRLAQFGLKRLPGLEITDADFAAARDELFRLGCEALADKPFGVLSQGERQQVLIARARMARPLLLVLDEPCAGMDPGVRERFLAWLNERLHQPETPTVVLVTHHIEEIVPGFQNTLVLSNGRVHSAGRTEEVVSKDTIESVYRTKTASSSAAAGSGQFGKIRSNLSNSLKFTICIGIALGVTAWMRFGG